MSSIRKESLNKVLKSLCGEDALKNHAKLFQGSNKIAIESLYRCIMMYPRNQRPSKKSKKGIQWLGMTGISPVWRRFLPVLEIYIMGDLQWQRSLEQCSKTPACLVCSTCSHCSLHHFIHMKQASHHELFLLLYLVGAIRWSFLIYQTDWKLQPAQLRNGKPNTCNIIQKDM